MDGYAAPTGSGPLRAVEAPLVARELHRSEDEPEWGGWWACAEPERPSDVDIIYDENCPMCRLKAAAVLLADGDEPLFRTDGDEPANIMLSDLAAGRVST